MSGRVIRLITGRELIDLFRDRRTLAILLLLPVLLYPGFGLAGYYFAQSIAEQACDIGVVNLRQLTKSVGSVGPLIVDGRFADAFSDSRRESKLLRLIELGSDDRESLDRREVHVILVAPADFHERLGRDETVTLTVLNRDGDEVSKLATQRLVAVLKNYDEALKKARFAKHGLPNDFDKPILVREPKDADTPLQRSSDELRDSLARFLPFVLVMWALAGALHPAIDLCAGEKERGTMETLLISPAERSEIVAGKFLAVWTYATSTAWWNLLWMGGLCLVGAMFFNIAFIRYSSLLWCALLTLPLTAFFSALSLALGVYARSTKEGQYYLMPLFLGVMPLVLLSLMPNAELTVAMCLIPVTGVCLFLQKMLGPTPWQEVLPYIVPVLISLIICVTAAGWWAIRQFHREDVLIREADGGGLRQWLSGFDDTSAEVTT